MRLMSWNVNGLRAVLKKGALGRVDAEEPAILCLQETRCDLDAENAALDVMKQTWHRGYWATGTAGRSGTAIFAKGPTSLAPRRSSALYDEDTGEGRVTSVLVEAREPFVLLSCYAPNTGREHRKDQKSAWTMQLMGEIAWLQKTWPVVLCGDWNAVLEPLDVHDYEGTKETPGNHKFERDDLYDMITSTQLVDVWRLRNPSRRQYTYWDYRGAMRRRGLGWRIDSFLVDDRLLNRVEDVGICGTIEGSDHCPVFIDIKEN